VQPRPTRWPPTRAALPPVACPPLRPRTPRSCSPSSATTARQDWYASLPFDISITVSVTISFTRSARCPTIRRIKAARFPVLKELADFDFSCISSPDKQRVLKLAQNSYIQKVEPILMVGNPGLGKPQPTAQIVDALTRTPAYSQPALLGYAEHACLSPRFFHSGDTVTRSGESTSTAKPCLDRRQIGLRLGSPC
jgi:hypothetical protein